MRPVALSDEIAVGAMPAAEQVVILARAGFRSLLNVQPDGEVTRLLSDAAAAHAAAAAGLSYLHVPLTSRRPSDGQVATLERALASLPKPIYACCYSGSRAAAAWALAMAPVLQPETIAAAGTAAGFDMSALLPHIAKRHADAKGAPEPVPAESASAEPAPAAPVAAEPAPPVSVAPVVSPVDTAATATSEPVPNAKAGAVNGVRVAVASAPAAAEAAAKIIYPRAAGAGGFAVSG